jgi:hypothetical protein
VRVQWIVGFFVNDKQLEILFIVLGVCFIFIILNQKSVDNGCNSIILLIMWIYAWNFVCCNSQLCLSLTLSHTHMAGSWSEPPMSAFSSSFLSVDGMTCHISL